MPVIRARRLRSDEEIIVVGGTFDLLHKGHKTLLTTAFEQKGFVIIGLTTDQFAKKLHKQHEVESYSHRSVTLRRFLRERGWYKRAEIIPLDNPYGIATTTEPISSIVVSEETRKRAEEINNIRKQLGLPPLKIITVKMVLAEDGRPISTTRIRKGERTPDGKLLR